MYHNTSFIMSLQSTPPSNPVPPTSFISFVLTMNAKFAARFGAVLIHNCGAIVGIRANRVVVGNSVHEALGFIREGILECGSRMSRWATDPRAVGCFCRRYDLDRNRWFIMRCLSTANGVRPATIEDITFSQLSLLATSSSTQLRFAIRGPTRPSRTLPSPH